MNKEEILKKISFIFVYLLIIIISGEIIFSLFIFVNNLNKSYKSLEIRYLETLENQKALSEYIKRSQKLGPFYSQPYLDFPVYKSESAPLILNAKAVISLLVKEDGKEKILYLKNRREKLPIASLTKLMTAHIALKLYHPDEIIVIKKEEREGQEAVGNYKVGEKFKLKDLLHSVLMESSNEAAIAIAQKKGVEEFVKEMNQEAKKIGLLNTIFYNPTGLPLEEATSTSNLSTVEDLAKLGKYLLKNDPEVLNISIKKQYNLYNLNGKLHHKVYNSNTLLTLKDEDVEFLGSKTGFTSLAKECFFFIIKAPNKKGEIINVILGSDDRFKEARQLIDWIKFSYQWEETD